MSLAALGSTVRDGVEVELVGLDAFHLDDGSRADCFEADQLYFDSVLTVEPNAAILDVLEEHLPDARDDVVME